MATSIPIKGARKMKEAIFRITVPFTTDNEPHLAIAAPAKPPISVCEEEEGIPNHQVAKFQIMAATIPENIIGNVTKSAITVLETVSAIPKPPIRYLAIKKATKLNIAAQSTAWKGVSTLVDTMVAIELAAS